MLKRVFNNLGVGYRKIIEPSYKTLFIVYVIFTASVQLWNIEYSEIGDYVDGDSIVSEYISFIVGNFIEITIFLFSSMMLVMMWSSHRKRKKYSKAVYYLDQFQRKCGSRISRLICDFGRGISEDDRLKKYDELCVETLEFFEELLKYVSFSFSAITDKDCCASIKLYRPSDNMITSRARDGFHSLTANRSSIDERMRTYSADQNTAFKKILEDRDSTYFISNNLRLQSFFGKYKNANDRWKQLYNAVLVVPITLKAEPSAIDQSGSVIGFLCIDCFGGRFDRDFCLHLASSYSRICWNIIDEVSVFGDEDHFGD